MIVRIELNQLDNRSGYYFFNDFLFTGEAYDHRDNQLYQVYEITDGVITGSRDYGFFKTSGMVKVDIDLLDSGDFDYEMNGIPYTYNDKPFTGVSFSYLHGFVFSESLYLNGWIVESIAYYPDGTGRIKNYKKKIIDPTETTGNREWSLQWESNSLKWIESTYLDFQGNHSGELKLYFNEQNQITTATIEGDYEYVSLLVPRDDLPLDFKTFNELLAKKDIFAEELSIRLIEDKLFNQWLDSGLLNQVKQLKLYHTKVQPLTIVKMQKLPSLQKLTISESKIYEDDDPLSIKQQTQRFSELATELFLLKVHRSIDINLVDDYESIFQKYLPDELKQQLT